MNKEELLKEYDEKAKALRDEFISKLEDDKKEFKLTYPEHKSIVYYISSSNGNIWDTLFYYMSEEDMNKFEQGQYFETREEAEQYLKERKLLFKLHQWAKEKNDGWKPDFTDDETKYYISCECSYGAKKLKVDWYINSVKFLKLPYFKSIELAKECIDLFGDEIKEVLV